MELIKQDNFYKKMPQMYHLFQFYLPIIRDYNTHRHFVSISFWHLFCDFVG